MRLERERELQEMRRMREQEMEMEELQVAKLRSTLSSSLQDGPKKLQNAAGGILHQYPALHANRNRNWIRKSLTLEIVFSGRFEYKEKAG